MKLKHVRVYLGVNENIYWQTGARLLDMQGNLIEPPITVESISFLPLFKETIVKCSDGSVTVYRGFNVSYEYADGFVVALVKRWWKERQEKRKKEAVAEAEADLAVPETGEQAEKVEEPKKGNEGDMPPASSGNA